MGLIVLKNQGYQEYQDALIQGVQFAEARVYEENDDEEQTAPSAREGKRRLQRYALLVIVCGVITGLSSATTIALYKYSTPPHALRSAAPAGTNDEEPATAAHETLWAEQRSLWRCGDESYTDTPAPSGQCEYIGAAAGDDDGGSRFITPSAPRS